MVAALGPLRLEISGAHTVRGLVEEELSNVGRAADSAASLGITITSGAAPLLNAVELTGSRLQLRHSVALGENGTLRFATGIKHGATLYTVDIDAPLSAPELVTASVYLPPHLDFWARITAPFARWLGRDSSTLLETAAKNVIYEIIDSLAVFRLLSCDASLLHASALARNGRAVVFAGTGGVGKSTALLAAMAQEPSLSYMSDDMIVVEGSGTVHRHPKRMQVYAYNVGRLPDVREAAMANMTAVQRWRWQLRARLLGPKQSRVRLTPQELFGADRVADVAELGAAVWIKPAPAGELSMVPIEPAEVARRCAVALVDEIWDFARLFSLASLLTPQAWSTSELQGAATAVLASALEDVPCYELTVPYGADPVSLVDQVMAAIDW